MTPMMDVRERARLEVDSCPLNREDQMNHIVTLIQNTKTNDRMQVSSLNYIYLPFQISTQLLAAGPHETQQN